MQGNVKALKFALGHELVYRDAAARLDRIEKSVEPYKKVREYYVKFLIYSHHLGSELCCCCVCTFSV